MSAEAHHSIQFSDLAGEAGHFLQLPQCVEAVTLLAVADDFEAVPLQRGERIDLLRGGDVDVDAVGPAHRFDCSSCGKSASGG